MADDNILQELASILHEVADVDPAEVTPDKSFVDDLDVDSLSMVEVAMAVEEKFGASIPDDEAVRAQDRRRRRHLHPRAQGLNRTR